MTLHTQTKGCPYKEQLALFIRLLSFCPLKNRENIMFCHCKFTAHQLAVNLVQIKIDFEFC